MLFQRDVPIIENWAKHPDEDKYRHVTTIFRRHLEGPDEETGSLSVGGSTF